MIKRVVLKNFKKFRETTFNLLPNGVTFLAGGNNSGKSTLLQALAIWEFCRGVLEMERGRQSLLTGYTKQGLGLSDDEFSPIAIASLKHLWTNLKTQAPGVDGYSLTIKCEWDDIVGAEKHLMISLALANDRLFIKAGSTNLTVEDEIPTLAYLPPFAGIGSRENFMSGAERRAMTGRGLAGGVIRNLLHDMHRENEEERSRLKVGRTKIKNSDLARLRAENSWEILQTNLAQIFRTQLEVVPFNSIYHSYIKVNCIKGAFDGVKFSRYKGYNARDLMAEGSGFLQWLSVYVLALNPSVSTILLDEPDAHLHPSLQAQLIDRLQKIAIEKGKQVLLATHSTEILRWADHLQVMSFSGGGAKYLTASDQKVGLFLGLGSDYAPKIDPLRRTRRLLIVENISDERMLKKWAEKIGLNWPQNIIAWPWTGGNSERKQLFLQLKAEIPELRAISIRDRDDQALNQVDQESLRDKTVDNANEDLVLRVWRRRHIENYVLFPPAIARASARNLHEVDQLMAEHALVVPQNFVAKDTALAMLDARGKEICGKGNQSIKAVLGVTPLQIASAMEPEEVPEDVRTLIEQIIALCA
ncbi:ATP-dependent nuclease [Asticcacaulis taihuensis]|uniref:ATPase/GTPase, AAA15 family n=1 Tax=Asticcacaulis taihuensis TaxID=260084 RepID=A0A1G4S313_9CAUL|nr:AAA family ATPase [Asticcacaulis taihuensis]SCW63381.1 ATPase/GTPase, AAA15 family [Asticcacaulis taihuensis]